jgi:phosphotriesterase-related protein
MISRRDLLAGLACSLRAEPVLPGSVLVHEHVLVNFKGVSYDEDTVSRAVKPHLEEIKRHGCRRFHDATPNMLGRNPALLQRLAQSTGLEIWTNTGLYAARNHQYLPDYAKTESAEQLAKRWIEEARKGVDGSKPRFIKIGVNRAPLHPLDKKIVRAAALCSRETGLTVASHTSGAGPAALEQLEIVMAEKLDPGRFVWVHAHNEKDHGVHERVARAGAWVEFDGLSEPSLNLHLECVRFMAGKKLLHRTLVSQDAGYYRPGEPNGGPFRPYALVYTGFLPRLETGWADQLFVENPVTAYGG